MTDLTASYHSPFHRSDRSDHDNDSPMCLSLALVEEPHASAVAQWGLQALNSLKEGLSMPAIYSVRHFAEIGMKAILSCNGITERGHNLEELLQKLEETPGWEGFQGRFSVLPEFIQDLQRIDKGSECRYAQTLEGVIALSGWCCANAKQLRFYFLLLAEFTVVNLHWDTTDCEGLPSHSTPMVRRFKETCAELSVPPRRFRLWGSLNRALRVVRTAIR